jgi:hypothetical protein
MADPQPTYYRVSPKFWVDSEAWSDDAKLLALYILTCDHRTVEGLFRLPMNYIAADLGWGKERLPEPFAELLAERFIEHDPANHLVLIVNALKYQSPQNPNMVKHAIRKLEQVPVDSPLTSTFKRLAERFCERLAERLPEGFGEGFAKPPAPTPAPTPPPESSSESSTTDAGPTPDPDDDRVEDQLLELAERALERREAEKGPVGNTDAWLRSAIAGHRRKHDNDPDYLERTLTATTPGQTPTRPSPLDGTALAMRARMNTNARRAAGLACATCDDEHLVLDEHNVAHPCPDCPTEQTG